MIFFQMQLYIKMRIHVLIDNDFFVYWFSLLLYVQLL